MLRVTTACARLMLVFTTVITAAGLLYSCGRQQEGALEPVGRIAGLPEPLQLLAGFPRGASSAVLTCAGSVFLPGKGQLVEAEGSGLRFSPISDSPAPSLDSLAFAIYRFNLQGVDNTSALSLSWTTPPEDAADLWLGLSRWASASWEWHSGPSTDTLELSRWGKLLYSEPSNGDLYVVVLLSGTTEAVLQELVLNGSSTPVAQLVAVPAAGEAPLQVSLDASASSSPAGNIVKYEWDWDGGGSGPWDVDTGATPTAAHEYATAGSFTAWVRVTDEIGSTATASSSISVTTLPGFGIWPMFKHDAMHTGRSSYVGAATNAVKWVYAADGIDNQKWSSPAIGMDSTVYFGCGNKLYALNSVGTLKWTFSANDLVDSSPVVDLKGTVYIGSHDSMLYAIDYDGGLKWSLNTDDKVWTFPVVASNETVYFGSYDKKLYAVKSDGLVDWTYLTGSVIDSGPAISADGTIYVGSHDENLYALYPNGSLKWKFVAGAAIGSSPAISPDGTIYFGCHNGYIYALNPNGTLKWSFDAQYIVWASPALGQDGTIFVGSEYGTFFAINADGSSKWSFSAGPPIDSAIDSSAAVGADGTIYFGCRDNNVYALNPDGSVKWFYSTGGPVRSSPAIGSDGTVYVLSGDAKLYAFGL